MKKIKMTGLLLVGLLGCGSETLNSNLPDASDPTCQKVDGYVEFNETATTSIDGSTCEATYSINQGLNTFKCDPGCPNTLCSQLSTKLGADGTKCLQSFN